MRILYGVVGEGMGHAMRSRAVLEHLTRRHEVQIVVSGRAHDYLKQRFEGVTNIWGFHIVYADNEVKGLRTLLSNLKDAARGVPKNVRRYFEMTDSFRPDAVVSDFESWSYLYGKNHFVPVICLDNIQMVDRCAHPASIVRGYQAQYRLTRALVKSKLPGCLHYLITTFFWPRVSKARTTLVPPVLRPQILAAKSESGDHLLVYQTSASSRALLEALKRARTPCRIYGVRRDITRDQAEGNLLFRPFSDAGFIEDLRTAAGVVANGGFTLLSEAVVLHKPLLCVPVNRQFEQVLNARYVEHLGYGKFARAPSAEAVREFVERLPRYRASLASYRQDGNRVALESLDALLAAIAKQW